VTIRASSLLGSLQGGGLHAPPDPVQQQIRRGWVYSTSNRRQITSVTRASVQH
jgi:hypothetical protein